MTRVFVSLLFLSLLGLGSVFGQYGLGMSMLRDNVISQKYNPANIMEGKNSKEYYGMILDYDSTSFKVGVDASGWIGNTGTSLKGVFAENGYITAENRNRIVADMQNGGSIGAGYNLGYANVNVKIKDKTWAFFLDESQTVNARIGDSATAGLAFFGNKRYLGQTISDDKIQFDYTYTRALGVGYGWNFLENDKLKFGVRGKILQGLNTYSLKNADYTMFTEENGARIDLDASYDLVMATNENPVTPFTFQGFGAAVDLGMIYQLDTNFRISASVIDAGAIFWNAHRYTNTVSDFDWQGLEIDDILNGGGLDSLDQTTDSLLNIFLPDSVPETYTTLTGVRLSVGAEWTLNEEMLVGATLWYAPMLNGPHTPLPLLNVSYQYQVHPNLRLGANAFGGGQDTYGLGLLANYHFKVAEKKTRFDIIVGSDNILGFTLPAAGRGANVYAGISVGM